MSKPLQADQKPAALPRRAGTFAKVLCWIALSVGGLLAALVMIVAVAMVFAIPIDISAARDRIEIAASNSLGRSFHVDGPMLLLPTLPPALQVESVRLGNPDGRSDSDLARLRLARVGLAILPLLRGEIRIDEITIEGLELQLETDVTGEPNWLIGHQGEVTDVKAAQERSVLRFVELRQLILRDVKVTHQDAATGKTIEMEFIEVTGAAKREHPLQLSIEGTVQQLPYQASLKGGSLVSLLEGDTAWPLEFSIAAVGASFRVEGTLEQPLHETGFRLDFDLQVPSTAEIEATFGMGMPAVNSLALTGQFSGGEGRYSLDELTGTLEDTRVMGNFEVDISGERPQLVGALHIPSIDVGPFSQAVKDVEGVSTEVVEQDKAKQQDGVQAWDLDAPFLSTDPLALFDADIILVVDEVTGATFSLEDASLGMKVTDGRLTAPVAVIVAGVPFKGQITLGDTDGMPEVNASLTALGTEVGELAKLLVDAEGIEGRFEIAGLDLSARGETLRALAETSALSFSLSEASLSYGHDTGGQPVEFTLNRLEMDFPAAQSSRITARGALLGEPFSLELKGGSFLDKFIYRQWPIELEATGSGARLSANGVVAPFGETHIAFKLAGERIGELARWVGVSQQATAGYQLDGELVATAAVLSARVEQGRLADTRYNGEVGIRRKSGKAVTLITLDAGVVDLDRLMELFPEPDQVEKPQDARKQYAIDVPILPKGIEIFDSDIELSIDRLKTGSVDVNRLKVSSRIRGGYVQRAPFQAGVAGALFQGGIGADLRGDHPKVNFDLKSMSLDIGELLEKLDLVSGLSLTTEQVEISAVLEGASARDMLAHSELSAALQGGMWRVGQSNLKKTLDITIGKGTITARRDQPTVLALNGYIDQAPLQVKLKTDSLASFAKPKERIRLDADIAVAKADIQLSGIAPLPVRIDDLHFKLALKGHQLSDFDELLKVSLPPWGPYDLRGEFGTLKTGYYVRGLYLDVGDSDFRGNLEFNGARAPPRLVLDLTADSIQLDDFDTGSWSAQGDERAAGAVPGGRKASAAKARALLSPAVMRSIDGALSIQVSEVLSGKDELGRGRLVATMERGRLSVDPLNLDIPGGSVDLAFSLEPTDKDLAFSTRAKVERLDYGYLARRIDPESTVAGLISLDVDVSTRGPGMATLMHDSNGHIDFAVWPEDIDASIFDLWATNLLLQVLPLLDTGTTSEVNCLVARFQLENGIMQPSAILVDTTRVQATAKGEIDFKFRKVDFRLVPRSKRPQMFSAETPLQVQGFFSDFSVGVSPGSLLGTSVRIITSPVVVPFQWVFTKRPPADGEAACQRVWGRVPASQPSEQPETAAK